ncbi:MAG: type II toxin-antitoxin system VapB family antitoxin [Bryobacterales bacterium]|jgi:antitoxin VapB|nr:type II toxin-antitoxin system VapB family antitoxin [Bryobacterales bacterium]
MSLNVKKPEAHALAVELAKLTGESLTTAVTRALEERLGTERKKHGAAQRLAKALQMAERFAEGMQPGCRSDDHDGLLYGDDGLPG